MSYSLEDFINKIDSSLTPQSMFETFKNYVAHLGFDKIVYTFFTDYKTQKSKHGVLSNYPESWMEYYKEKNYFIHDPVAQKAYETAYPFFWHDLNTISMNDIQKTIMLECQEAGLYHGVGIPLHAAKGGLAGIGLATSYKEKPDLNQMLLSKLALATQKFHWVYCGVLTDTEPQKRLLTQRENEILKWWVIGKTTYEISMILYLSEATIKFHISNIYKKLQVNSKSLAILKALKLDLIEIDKIIL